MVKLISTKSYIISKAFQGFFPVETFAGAHKIRSYFQKYTKIKTWIIDKSLRRCYETPKADLFKKHQKLRFCNWQEIQLCLFCMSSF